MRSVDDTLITVLWGVIGVTWLTLATRTKRTVERRGKTVSIFLAAALLYSVARAVVPARDWAHPLWLASPVLAAAGVALMAAGVGFAMWARLTIGANWSGAVVLKQDHELIVRGPYALARHPIYTGFFAMFAGSTVVTGEAAVLVGSVIATVALVAKSRVEERLMLETFPDQYPQYRRRVKAIVPFVI
ncbi:MAG: methyltransferase family protein [Acidimicrobiales bacterium]